MYLSEQYFLEMKWRKFLVDLSSSKCDQPVDIPNNINTRLNKQVGRIEQNGGSLTFP